MSYTAAHVVEFYAYLGKAEGSLGLHHTLIFDTVITNVGSSYNRHDGVFTVPVSGVTELMVNSDKKGGTRSDSHTVREDHSSSGCVVVEISQRDIVFIRTHPTSSSTGFILSDLTSYMSSFSGWLLK